MWPKAAIGVRLSRSRWLYRYLRNCSEFTPTCLRLFQPTLPGHSRLATRRHPGSQPTNGAPTKRSTFSIRRALAMPSRWATARRRYTALRTHPSAWILDHDASSVALMSRVFDGQPEGLTREDVLDDITLYWLTNTAISSARLYWENKLAFFSVKNVSIPVAVSVFPNELYPAPRS